MVIYELIEACDEQYESWENSIGLYKRKEDADKEAESMNTDDCYDTTTTYYVVERELVG